MPEGARLPILSCSIRQTLQQPHREGEEGVSELVCLCRREKWAATTNNYKEMKAGRFQREVASARVRGTALPPPNEEERYLNSSPPWTDGDAM